MDTNSRSSLIQAIRQGEVTEIVDGVFFRAKMRIACPPRWRVLFLAAAEAKEKQLAILREDMFCAAAVDDVPTLQRLEKTIDPLLWNWWSFDLGLVSRASERCRYEQLMLMPRLQGKEYSTVDNVLKRRQAIEEPIFKGSPEAIKQQQIGELYIDLIKDALSRYGEIDVEEFKKVLSMRSSGDWQDTLTPAVGVNHSAEDEGYAGWRPLHFVAVAECAKETGAEIANMLLDARSDPLAKDVSGGTALHLAAGAGNLPVIDVLLRSGVALEEKDLAGCTALLVAAKSRKSAAVRRLAQWSMPPGNCVDLWTAEAELHAQRYTTIKGVELHECVADGDRDKVRELIQVGDGQGGNLADQDFVDSYGRGPMHVAATHVSGDQRSLDLIRCLAAMGTNIDLQDCEGNTALHAATRENRSKVVRTLLRLKAHPAMTDNSGMTPLMLAAARPKEVRQHPKYDGPRVNEPKPWAVVEAILLWDGQGEPPGPPIRKFRPPLTLREEAEQRQKDRHNGKAKFEYITRDLLARLRGDAIAALGFDDQPIFNKDGEVNRGDRLHLDTRLVCDGDSDDFDCPHPPDQPLNRKRMHMLWNLLTQPLLEMELKDVLPRRLSDLLNYILLSILGPKGPCFGLLVSSCIGTSGACLPSWAKVEIALRDLCEDVDERVDLLRKVGFHGPLPKKATWVGSVWEFGDYPREPAHVPWPALSYIDESKAIRLKQGANKVVRQYSVVIVRKEFSSDNDDPVILKVGQRGRVREMEDGDALVKFDDHEVTQLVFQENFVFLRVEVTLETEAFKFNDMPAFDPTSERTELPSDVGRRPFRSEQLQLQNRLFVDEALGLLAPAGARIQVVGELLLCPLLEEAAKGLTAVGLEMERLDEFRPWLRYICTQMEEPEPERGEISTVAAWEKRVKRIRDQRRPYAEAWDQTRKIIAAVLIRKVEGWTDLGLLTPGADSAITASGSMEELDKSNRGPPVQSSVMPAPLVSWITKKHTTRAFIELRRLGSVTHTDDFNEVVKNIGARSPQNFTEHFWRGVFYLLIWGRAKFLEPFFAKELRERIPDGATIDGPFVRPRADYLLEMSRKAKELAKQKTTEDAKWLAWQDSERKRKETVGKIGPEAAELRRQAKIIDPKFLRHLSTWKGTAYTGPVAKPIADDDGMPTGGGISAARKLKKKPPPAVDNSLSESLAATGADGLPSGLTDVLRVEIVCDTVGVLKSAFAKLVAPPKPPPPARSGFSEGDEGEQNVVDTRGHVVSFRVERVVNDFHKDQGSAVLPRAARILLLARFSVCARGIGTTPVDQLVEVELLLPWTVEARWLAEYINLDPADLSNPEFNGLAAA